MALSENITYPLISYEEKSDDHGQVYDSRYLCLYRATDDSGKRGDFCGIYKRSFNTIINHLIIEHKRPLQAGVDFCSDCCLLHNGKLEALSHALSHVLMYQNRRLALESHSDIQALDDWLQPIFQIASEQREKVLHRLFFGDDQEVEEAILQV